MAHTSGDDDNRDDGTAEREPPPTSSPAEDEPDEVVSARDATDSTEPNTTAATRPEGLVDTRRQLFRLVGRTYRDRFRTLLTVSVLPGLPVALAWWVFLRLSNRDGVLVNGIPTPLDWTSTPIIVSAVVLSVATLLVSVVSLGAGIIISGAGMLGQEVTSGAALRRAVRRIPAALVWWLLVVFAMVVAFGFGGYVTALLDIDNDETAWTVVFGLVPLIYLTWIVVSLPVALLENKGLFRSLRIAWRIGRDQRIAYATFVFASFALAYGIPVGLGWGLTWLAFPITWGQTPILIVTTLAMVLVWPLLILLLTAPILLDLDGLQGPRHLRFHLDIAKVRRQLPHSDSPRQPAPRVALAAAIAILALAPTVAHLNPAGAPIVSSQPLDGIELRNSSVAVLPQGKGAELAISTSFDRGVISCNPICDSFPESDYDPYGINAIFAEGKAYFTEWTSYSPTENSEHGLQLWACGDSCPRIHEGSDETHTTIRPDDRASTSLHTAMTTTSNGLLVVSSIESGEEIGTEVQAHHCPDADCTNPDTVELPSIPISATRGQGRALDATVGPDGEFVLSGIDSKTGEVNLVTCADFRCEDPVVTQIAEPLPVEIGNQSWDRVGTAVEVTPDRSPVLAYRDATDGAIHVVACEDLPCDDATSEQITGPGWKRPAPAMALDSAGLPQIATFDMEHERLMLVSCADSGCAEMSETPLVPLSLDPQFVEMEIDNNDRPYLAWGQETNIDYPRNSESTLTVCADARCGA